MEKFNASIHYDKRMWREDVQVRREKTGGGGGERERELHSFPLTRKTGRERLENVGREREREGFW